MDKSGGTPFSILSYWGWVWPVGVVGPKAGLQEGGVAHLEYFRMVCVCVCFLRALSCPALCVAGVRLLPGTRWRNGGIGRKFRGHFAGEDKGLSPKLACPRLEVSRWVAGSRLASYRPLSVSPQELLDSGLIGDVCHIQHLEPVSGAEGNWPV